MTLRRARRLVRPRTAAAPKRPSPLSHDREKCRLRPCAGRQPLQQFLEMGGAEAPRAVEVSREREVGLKRPQRLGIFIPPGAAPPASPARKQRRSLRAGACRGCRSRCRGATRWTTLRWRHRGPSRPEIPTAARQRLGSGPRHAARDAQGGPQPLPTVRI